jgi:hypothetical protein
MMATAAEVAFNALSEQATVGKKEPFPILYAELPIAVSYDGNDGSSHIEGPIGIYVRARKTNLDFGMRYDLTAPILEATGMSSERYSHMFKSNLVQDLLYMLNAGQIHLGMHTQNVSMLGNIKDEEDFSPWVFSGSKEVFDEMDDELASTVGYVVEHFERVNGMFADGLQPTTGDWRLVSEMFDRKISSLDDLFFASRDTLIKVTQER